MVLITEDVFKSARGRLRGNMIALSNCLKRGRSQIRDSLSFQPASNKPEGHSLKLKQAEFKLDIRKDFS